MSTRPADFALPELTRSLRALGSARWLRDADHARFFTPLLTARRNAARVRTAEGQVAAFQADRLRRAFTEAVEQMAAARHPKSAPDRRAYAARLSDAGLAVGRLQEKLKIAPSTLSHHIKALVVVGLVNQVREATTLVCHANYEVMRDLVGFLVAECCTGVSEGKDEKTAA